MKVRPIFDILISSEILCKYLILMYQYQNFDTSNNQRLGSAGEDDAICYWVNKKVSVFKL